MAAMTRRLLRLRPNLHSYPRSHSYPLHHFSSSSDHDPPSEIPRPDSATQTSFSSKFDEVKANLRREPPPQNREQPPRKPLSFSSRNPPQNPPPSRPAGLDEIRQNLSEFRARSDAPSSPSSGGGQYISLRELYRRSVNSEAGGSATSSDSVTEKPSVDPAARRKFSFDTVRESLHQIKGASHDSGGKPVDSSSLARLRESLKLSCDPNSYPDSPAKIGGNYSFPSTFQGGKGDDNLRSTGAFGLNFSKIYDHLDLGKKLKELRPEKRKGKWFSLQELNDRLAKLREIEEKKSNEKLGGFMGDLRDRLKLDKSQAEKSKQHMMQRLDILSHLGGTPSFMLSPPNEHLVEKYFHPDNMSSAEKLKLELKKVRDEFKMSESDCGSARVQVAQLTTKIKHLSNVLQKKDKHSRRGLQAMVQRRKKLLKYLRRTDWDSYCLVLSKLGLRDNPDIKA